MVRIDVDILRTEEECKMSVLDTAKYVLHHAGDMATMKLEKLVYYCQAWSLAWDGVPLFEEEFQAWANGPVCLELFATHKGKFWLEKDYYDDRPDYPFTKDQIETMDAVLKGYADKEPQYLSELTHRERPWKETRSGVAPGAACSRVIDKTLMQEYYGGISNAEE